MTSYLPHTPALNSGRQPARSRVAADNFNSVGDPADSHDVLGRHLGQLLLVVIGHAAPKNNHSLADFNVKFPQRRKPCVAQGSGYSAGKFPVGIGFNPVRIALCQGTG
jgi:hypothetical protein